jgi:hypothetical protein
MKKSILVIAILVAGFAATFISGCKKDDTTAPVVSITGADPFYLVLNSAAYTDPGATANDNTDGNVTVTNNITSSNPDKNLAGTYVITYSATDKAGNVGTATRTVIVYNEANVLEGNYNVTDTTKLGYHDQVIASKTENRKISFQKFAAYDPAVIYATVSGSGDITVSSAINVASQTIFNAGSPPGDRNFTGTGTFSSLAPYRFTINYIETTNGTPVAGKGIYTKQ